MENGKERKEPETTVMTMTDDEKKKEKGDEVKGGLEVPKPGASLTLTDEVKDLLSPEMVAAIEAGAPVVVMVQETEEGPKVHKIRTFEKGYAISGKKGLSVEEAEVLGKDLTDLIAVHDHLRAQVYTAQEYVDKAEGDWKKMFNELRLTKKKLTKKKDQLKHVKGQIKTLYDEVLK